MRGTANVESPSRASTDLRAAVIGLWCINDTIAALNQTDNAVLQDGELQQTLVDYYNNLLADIVCRFQKTAALNVRSRLHYSSGGVDPSGNDGCCRPSADAGRTFRNRPFDAAPMAFAQG